MEGWSPPRKALGKEFPRIAKFSKANDFVTLIGKALEECSVMDILVSCCNAFCFK
jgi:hypothetical protein